MADRYREDDRYWRDRGGEDWRERDERWRGGTGDRERGFADRASDEVRSWFGNEDAERRREWDRLRDRERDRGERGEWRGAYDRQPSRERGYGEPQGREWRDAERERQRDQSYGGPASFNRERDFGRTDRYANTDEGIGYARRSYPGGGGYGDAYEIDRGSREVRGTSGYDLDRWRDSGPHYGRGPRGYQRSDERIREDVCERLARDGRIDASDIDIRVENGEVTLDGSVDSRDTKRLAEDVVEDVFGVRDVRNQLRVYRPDRTPVGTGGKIGTMMKGMTGTEDPVTKSEK